MSRRLLPVVAAVLAVLATATVADAGERPAEYVLPGEQVFPEGIARGRGPAFFVGSTTDGTIFRGDVRRPATRVLSPGGTDGRTTAVGMRTDARGRRLFVAGGATGRAFVLDTRDGSTVATLDSGVREGTFVNDVAVTRRAAYFTDSRRPMLLRARLRGRRVGPLRAWLSFAGTPLAYREGFNANGIVSARGGRVLLVVQSNTGLLFRIDTRTRRVEQVDLGDARLTNGDGMLLVGRTLYVVRNRQELIVPVRLRAGLRRGSVGEGVTSEALRFPTTIARDGRRLLVVNSQFDRRGGQPVLPFTVVAIARPRR